MEQYFYHPDHLGSTSWITDGSGNAIQYMHYLPYGEAWIDQQSTSWNAPYTFSGKEKDVETGYGYFGARYYDSGLSIWLSVDPMSDKYPSMSPYNYCANNPVMMVDPDGNEICVEWGGTIYKLSEGKIYVNGNEQKDQIPDFVNEINNCIIRIKKTTIGKEILAPLEKNISDGGPNIKIINDDNLEVSQIDRNENVMTITMTTKGLPTPCISRTKYEAMTQNSLLFNLFHEFSHAYDKVLGKDISGYTDGISNDEWVACYRENLFRIADSPRNPLRSHYWVTPDILRTGFVGSGEKVLDGSCQPIDPTTKIKKNE